jgi:hypothetical protein
MARHNASRGHGAKPAVKASGGWTHLGHGILSLDSNPTTHIRLVGGHRGKYESVSLQKTNKALHEAPPTVQVEVATVATETATA